MVIGKLDKHITEIKKMSDKITVNEVISKTVLTQIVYWNANFV